MPNIIDTRDPNKNWYQTKDAYGNKIDFFPGEFAALGDAGQEAYRQRILGMKDRKDPQSGLPLFSIPENPYTKWALSEQNYQQPSEIQTPRYMLGADQTTINSTKIAPNSFLDYHPTPQIPAFPTAGLGTSPTVDKTTTDAGKVIDYSKTPEEVKRQNLIDRLQELNNKYAQKDVYQQEQNVAYNIPELTKIQNDLSAKLKVSQLEAANIQAITQPNTGVTSAIDQRQRAEALRLNSVQSLQLYAQLEMAKGNLATAQDAADRAVNLKYAPIEAEIKAGTANLNLIKESPDSTLQEKKRADERQAILDAKKAQIELEKENAQDVWKVLLEASKNGPVDAVTSNAIVNAVDVNGKPSKEKALQIASQAGLMEDIKYETRNVGGREIRFGFRGGKEVSRQDLGAVGKENKLFSGSQLNKGAATAGIPIKDFTTLSDDDKNYFINNGNKINSMKKTINKSKDNGDDPMAIEAEISSSNSPDVVKDSLVRYLWSVFPKPENDNLSWWQKLLQKGQVK